MSDKPRIGSYLLGEQYPNKLAVYNLDFADWANGRVTYMAEPWVVDRGNQGLGQFPTFEEALEFVRDEIDMRLTMEVS